MYRAVNAGSITPLELVLVLTMSATHTSFTMTTVGQRAPPLAAGRLEFAHNAQHRDTDRNLRGDSVGAFTFRGTRFLKSCTFGRVAHMQCATCMCWSCAGELTIEILLQVMHVGKVTTHVSLVV
jgi:hypothetical protein